MGKNIEYEHISFETMLMDFVNLYINNVPPLEYDYFWKNGEDELHEIVEFDLMRGRFCTEDGDFSEFDWEIENSRIYRKVHKYKG